MKRADIYHLCGLICLLASVGLLMLDREGWGWFLFAAIVVLG